jgi:hypothetical protein
VCGCLRAGGDAGRQWACRSDPDANTDPECPGTKPTTGSSCGDAGTGTVCRYGFASGCVCDGMDQWRCLP